ncbi:MAG TPA: aminoglycoside phosphotransferase family protein [Solirubrobacterales bacterium]|nr:aminoglycoside phosphotransferase family protein [Solirubrobacterales bacterium]
MEREVEARALAAARAVAAEHGVACDGAEVLSAGSNVLVHLRPSPVVARVMTGTVVLHDDPERWLRREVGVTEFLAPTGLAVRPSPLIASGPFERDGLWMTFTEFVEGGSIGFEVSGEDGSWSPGGDGRSGEAVAVPAGDGAEWLGRALRELHEALAPYDGDLAGFADLHDDIERLRLALRPSPELSAERIDSLGERLATLRQSVFATSLPVQALHGDASVGNLLRTSGGLIWNDFEDTFLGPVHWDVTGYLMSLKWLRVDEDFVDRTLDAYGGLDREELALFRAAHELYDEIWSAYDAQRRG